MAKKYLVKFDCTIGDYEHSEIFIFDKKMSEYGYCKKFWGLTKKNELKTNVFCHVIYSLSVVYIVFCF